jgi:hypothetical protein
MAGEQGKLLCFGDTEVNLLRLIAHLTVFNIAFLEFFYYIAIIQERNSKEFEICSAAFQYPSFLMSLLQGPLLGIP